jgi:hypothetical protein
LNCIALNCIELNSRKCQYSHTAANNPSACRRNQPVDSKMTLIDSLIHSCFDTSTTSPTSVASIGRFHLEGLLFASSSLVLLVPVRLLVRSTWYGPVWSGHLDIEVLLTATNGGIGHHYIFFQNTTICKTPLDLYLFSKHHYMQNAAIYFPEHPERHYLLVRYIL